MKKRKGNQREYGMPKYELINKLYQLQAAVCPLCRLSLLTELQMYVAWKTRTPWKGQRLKRKQVNLNIDHIKARALNGEDVIDNLALTHRLCNTHKDNNDFIYERPKRDT